MKTTATRQQVADAIASVNTERGYEIKLNRNDQQGKWFNFTLKTRGGIPGARTSWSGRNLPSASWHAHGYVMDKIFELNPDAVIVSLGKKLYAGFEWEDTQIGSRANPVYFSSTSIL